MRNTMAIAITAAIGFAASSAQAVVLNPRGTGQVLIYPYYTVNAGFGTLLSLVNSTPEGKALKVHIREGYNGRSVLDFNLYLSPFDAWVAHIFDTSSDGSGAAAIATNDNSCTVPKFFSTFSPAPGQGGTVSFSNAGYSGTNADGGPAALSRTREGYVEIIEMGTVTNDHQQTLNKITHGSSGIPSSCSQVVMAWASGGYWTTDATTDIEAPDGGLFGAESIINVGAGLLYTVNAEAIDGFSSVVQHTLPGSATPDLSSASKSADGTVSAFVPIGAAMVEAKYDRPEDAISALFMADNLYNEFVVDAGIGAMTDWIVTFPTKRFYTDPALLQAAPARLPFDTRFGQTAAGIAPVVSGPTWFNREEDGDIGCGFLCPSNSPSFSLLYAANVVPFGTTDSTFGSHLLITDPIPVDLYQFGAGHLLLSLIDDWNGEHAERHVLASAGGIAFAGLPAIGFAAINYVNGNVTPGTLANYSGTFRHRSSVACSATPPMVCP
jgi:hypothetical protein